ncbi:hypothetical protein [Arthrobacter nitrophenolicus]|uniref:Uncharacterized protein n=1 Tax=Arthrobacter nitrophenolicus TaxID=683150 RepID=L8TQE2_9MICC|nr:hypothetical protein [Arthrobacter nitrophenolicus]ELT44100.1 hypothetical protein G205_14261 [Arthrobacter nitrophenolicus]
MAETDTTDSRLAQLLAATVRRDPNATIELTVVVDGTIISGSAVSEQAWERRQNDQVRAGSPEVADALESGAPASDERKLSQDPYLHFLGPVLVTGGRKVCLQATRSIFGKSPPGVSAGCPPTRNGTGLPTTDQASTDRFTCNTM